MVQIIPKKIAGLPNWLNALFYFSLVLLIVSIVSYFVLGNSLKKNQGLLAEVEETLVTIQSSDNLALEKKVLSSQKKINDFSQLKGDHFKPSAVFNLIEKNSHPQVWFSQFNLEANQGKVTLAGQTQSFETLGQQLLIFQKAEDIKGVSLSKLSINKEGKIEFTLSLIYE